MHSLTWWQKAVFYQIYPRSFADGNGDGIGDIPGIISKLDYLQALGIDAIWLSPHYPSPLFDCGYDVADYTGVAPEYGTLDDFRTLLDEAHRREIRLILDLVLNHTSHAHPWFVESRAGRDSAKRDWYVWRDGRDGGPPNNWNSCFGGSAWERDPATGQYYYHFFLKEQPDLNWRNPEVKAALFAAIRFWLDMGVDGFRLDAIDTIFEDPDMPDHESPLPAEELHRMVASGERSPNDPEIREAWELMYRAQMRQPGIHELFREIRALVDSYEGDRVLVGETEDVLYYGSGSDELHIVFNFPLMKADRLTPAWIRANQALRLGTLPPGAWPCNTLGNHDSSRIYGRYGDGKDDAARARLSLAVMLTLKGTPFLYNGEEIGMADALFHEIAWFRDLLGLWHYGMHREAFGAPYHVAVERAARTGRDKCRTPMQWADAPFGGFCPPEATPWLPVTADYGAGVNVADQEADPNSLLNFYRRLLHVRRAHPALIAGDYRSLAPEAEDYMAFTRSDGERTCLVVLNFSERAHELCLDLDAERIRTVFSSHDRDALPTCPDALRIAPFEIYVGALEAAR